ncbi:unnamed protein product, partial [Pylaiella littoralis]
RPALERPTSCPGLQSNMEHPSTHNDPWSYRAWNTAPYAANTHTAGIGTQGAAL